MFQLNNICYTVPDRVLLDNINLTFSPAKVYGLIGHNGSGKSTLLKLLTRQIQASSGSILLHQQEINQIASRDYAKQVAYLPQHLPTDTQLTAYELISMGRYAWRGLFGRMTQQDKDAIQQALLLTQTENFKNQIVDILSGGERSRIWLAMCLAQQSQFLLLDEPLAPLDIAHQLEVMNLIQTLSRQLKLGIIIVIHDINLAAQYCDELIALKQGQLLKQGTPSEIMTRDILHQIYGVNMTIIQHPKTDYPIALP